MKAIIPAAGMGTRFLPATKSVPKEMLPVLDKPVIQYVVEEALRSGVDEVVIVSNRDKHAIEAHFAPDDELVDLLERTRRKPYADAVADAVTLGERIEFVYQDAPLGLGHAVHCAHTAVGDERFYVLLGDTIIPDADVLESMRAVSDANGGASVIAVFPVPLSDVSRFGVISGSQCREDLWRVTGIVEKPAPADSPSNLAVFGRYLLTPRVMELLATTAPGVGGEIQLTDALAALLAEEEVYALVIDPEAGFDTGTVESWLATNVEMMKRFSSRAVGV